MRLLIVISFLLSIATNSNAQNNINIAVQLKAETKKGDYIILELRLNREDEFRTLEGGSSSLARIAVYSGKDKEGIIVEKGFEGMNAFVKILNNLKHNSFRLVEVYTIKGESLIITHYVLERKK